MTREQSNTAIDFEKAMIVKKFEYNIAVDKG
jgi:hypothetical protein